MSSIDLSIQIAESTVYERFKHIRPLYWGLKYHKNIRGEAMFPDLYGSYYLWDLYRVIDSTANMVVEKSAQCGLSELFIIQSHIEAGERGMSVMYILPKYELRNRFVNNRIYKLHKRVPHYQELVTEAATKVHRTSLMHFGKGTLAYVGSNVEEEFIEIPVDSAFIDEKDACNAQNLLMLPDRLTASPYQFEREISNPRIEGYGIDERYIESSQGAWNIRCDHCGEWFVPDFFQHVVEETSPNVFRLRDESANPDPLLDDEISLIHDCGHSVDRLSPGEWVHAYESRKWKGFRISKIFSRLSPKATLRSLYQKWLKAVGNDRKVQIFYNFDLGLPYSSAGAKLTRPMLNSCIQKYEYPPRNVHSSNHRFMGIDVGASLHVVLRERINIDGVYKLRLIGAWILPGFSQLVQILREWKPNVAVIDSGPELHKVMELKEDFSHVWSSKFQIGLGVLNKDRKKRELSMDRTALMDHVKGAYEEKEMVNPENAEFIEGGSFYAHLLAPTRFLDVNEKNPEKSRFVWSEGSRPDHFFLADAYCYQGHMMSPNSGMFEFFEQEADTLASYSSKRDVTGSELSDRDREKIAELQKLTPAVALSNVAENNKPKEIKPKVDDEKIRDTINMVFKSQGYVDIYIVSDMVNENESDVRRVLLTLGFKETRIQGQYGKG